MKILVTSGGTTEYIDDVRVLTNISTGKLGSVIADTFWRAGHEVSYIAPKTADQPKISPFPGINFHTVTDVESVMKIMKELVPVHQVVIHSMAVSDFGFERKGPTKLKSNDPEGFIEYMRSTIRKNPKILSHIKDWNPDCFLVGFKFEVGLGHSDLINIAHQSLVNNRCDLVVANDKEEMVRSKEHIAYILNTFQQETKAVGKADIAHKLLYHVNQLANLEIT